MKYLCVFDFIMKPKAISDITAAAVSIPSFQFILWLTKLLYIFKMSEMSR